MAKLKPPYPPAYPDPIFHQPMPVQHRYVPGEVRQCTADRSRMEAPGTWCRETWRRQEEYHRDLLGANRRMLENHRNRERRAAWRMRCLEEYGFVPAGDVTSWRALTCEK